MSDDDARSPSPSRRLRLVLAVVAGVALLLAAGVAGWGVGHRSGSATVGADSVDAGFARDMSVHHQQAVTMAIYERQYTTDPDLQLLAYNIEDTQAFELGQMHGWLETWGLPPTGGQQMAWMGHSGHLVNGLMPGMATATQLERLKTARGKQLDVLFLQLMIHHHQGGLSMAKYAAAHASKSYVRTLANTVITAQTEEIVSMESKLRQLGGTPLAPPAS